MRLKSTAQNGSGAQIVVDASDGPGGRGVGHASGGGYHLGAGPGHVLL